MSRRHVAVVATLLVSAGVLSVQAPAQAASERMQLSCTDGRVLERSNGSSWWGVDHDAVYVSERIDITGAASYSKEFGGKGPLAARSTCVGQHAGSTWTVALVQVRPAR